MKKYLREIEVSGVILTAIGIICTVICLQLGNESASNFGLWACGLGLRRVPYELRAFQGGNAEARHRGGDV